MALRTLLAGPILRRAEPSGVWVWIATSAPVSAAAEVFGIGTRAELTRLGAGRATCARLGERLFIHLIKVTPDSGSFPTDALLGYDLVLTGSGGEQRRLADLGLLKGAGGLAYTNLPLPTFFIRGSIATLHLLHGSCRLLHGKGEDALIAADALLDRCARNLSERPAVLLLTGDQVYGDEVAGPLITHLRRLATQLCGQGDETSVPGAPPLSTVPVYGRDRLATQRAGFTSGKASNHLLSFGEFAAMYLLAWDEGNWPEEFPSAAHALPGATARRRWRYDREVVALEATRRGLPSARRVLANCPTYMIFDDHDVTDDWNLTAVWRDRVHANPTGRRVVANALAAFWAFQGWGNDPHAYDDAFTGAITGYLNGSGAVDGQVYDAALWAFERWSYVAPTDPPTLMLDTRTQRVFDSTEGAARLIGPRERARIIDLCRRAGHRPGQPLILVSAVPVYGLELQERRQKFLVGKLGPYEIDFEAWHSNLAGLVDFMRLLINELALPACVLLSGDVHYGITIKARFAVGGKVLPIAQLVSSSLKHGGQLSRLALDALGAAVTRMHHRIGWDRPPQVNDPTGVKDKVLSRPVNVDEWASGAVVFLSPRRARQLGISQPADYRESRRYLRPAERAASVVVGVNNVGLVSLRGDQVRHQLLTCERGASCTHTTAITLPALLTP